MRRRQRPVPAEVGMPEHLARFQVEDWPVGPPPPWWDSDREAWPYFKARLLHMRAVRAWKDAQTITVPPA